MSDQNTGKALPSAVPTTVSQVPTAYGRLYAPMAVLSLCLSFATMFEPARDGSITTTYGSLWTMAGNQPGGPGFIAVMLMAALVALLLGGTFHAPRSAALPVFIAVFAGLAIVMLMTKPGTGTPKPPLADGGAMLLGLAWSVLLVGTAHGVHLTLLKSRTASSQ